MDGLTILPSSPTNSPIKIGAHILQTPKIKLVKNFDEIMSLLLAKREKSLVGIAQKQVGSKFILNPLETFDLH